MARIDLARLRLTVPDAALVARGRFLAEEALHCAGEDGGSRLLLIRRADLGALPCGTGAAARAAWTARTAAVLRAQTSGARHALAPGAEAAAAVWFASEAEARAALALLLVRGRIPGGWFWRLAVPEWRGGGWTIAAPALLSRLAALPGGRAALARVTVQALSTGDAAVMLAPVTEALVAMLVPARPPGGVPPALRSTVAFTAAPGGATELRFAARTMAARAVAALAPQARSALGVLLGDRPTTASQSRFLGAQVTLAAAPDLEARPQLWATTIEAVVSEAVGAIRPVADLEPAQWLAALKDRAEEHPVRFPSPPAPGSVLEPATIREPRRRQADRPAAAPQLAEGLSETEHFSAAAGLFLLVQPLARLRLPVWLERNPSQPADFAWHLLHSVARRMRVPERDHLWFVLAEALAGEDPSRDASLDTWRIGLDRWLRRRARITLAATIGRPGWLLADVAQVTARFAPSAADIRLRRLALDADPGWVPWLGRRISFQYRDRLGGILERVL